MSRVKAITVKSQEELDAIPEDFAGIIYIEFGTWLNKAIVNKNYYGFVVARGNSSVAAYENSTVVAYENSSVVAWENSSVVAWNNSTVVAYDNSTVEAYENSSVVVRGNSSVLAWENSTVKALENSSVEAYENSSVVARGNSSVVARGNSSVLALENSSVEALENSSVTSNANAQIVDRLRGGKIEITGNARIVYMPKTIEEYCSFYGIKHNKKTGRFYKCVHKREDGVFVSDRNSSFTYEAGKKTVADLLDTDTSEDCGHGIHISYLSWVLDFGRDWDDLAIIEVEADLDGIVIPDGCSGKVRCAEVTVLREVPLEECGTYGKILAKRRTQISQHRMENNELEGF